MEIKVGCGCGQSYKFDVEPVNARMPVKIACPSCGADGTESANDFLAQQIPNQPPPIPVAMRAQPVVLPSNTSSAGALRINHPASAPAAATPPLIIPPPRPSPAVAGARPKPKREAEYSIGMGVLGAILGAAVGAGIMYGFFKLTDFRFPFMGTCIGALAGLGARTLAKGTDMTLGVIAGGIALFATAGTLYLMYGEVAGGFILSMIVSVYFAYRIAG